MAKINDNLLVKGARGHVGKQFNYRRRGNDTILAKMPRINDNLEPTAAQQEVRDQFSSASLYAQSAVSSPDLKKQYQKKAGPGKTAYNMAFRDFTSAPVVKKIDMDKYNGTAGSVIVVSAKDDFQVAEVRLSIRNAAGALVEEGNAVLNTLNRLQWIYTATQVNNPVAGSVIKATAIDLAGNKGTQELIA